MCKENLFKLIRNEDVVIWAGSGMSFYAGYPTSDKLGKIFFEDLSLSEQNQINPNLTLPELTEEIYRIKGNNKNFLLKKLKELFIDYVPRSTEYHNKLATISHIKTIITTNYDKLFENGYKQNCQIVYSANQIPYLDKDKAHIFKVHGDMSEPNSIILTKTDYNNFFRFESQNDIYWTIIKERISTRSVLFLGYNLEDPNTSVIFDKILDVFKSHRKEWFLVAPNLAQHKVNNLISKGVHYIDSTAELLIEELINNLKYNVIDDLEKGIVDPNTFINFLSNNNLKPEIKGDKDSYTLSSLRGITDEQKGVINLTLKNETNLIDEINEFFSGQKFGELEITNEKLVNTDINFAGFKLPSKDGVSKVKFISQPKMEIIIDIVFDGGFEFTNLPVKLYVSEHKIQFQIDYQSLHLIISFNPNNIKDNTNTVAFSYNFEYKHDNTCVKVKEEIEIFKLLNNLSSGNRFTIFMESKKIISQQFSVLTELQDEAIRFLEYFEYLKIVENKYNIRFDNLDFHSISQKTYRILKSIVSIITENKIENDWDDELKITLENYNDKTIEQFLIINEANPVVTLSSENEEIIELHGKQIPLGFKKINILNPYVANINSILERKEKVAKIKSKDNKVVISYSSSKITSG